MYASGIDDRSQHIRTYYGKLIGHTHFEKGTSIDVLI